ncbi:MAG: AAA family ATPase [Rubripirellula sp.]
MLHTLAISGYRSLKEIVVPMGQSNVITGPNGSGKSSIYRSLRLLADAADGRLIPSLAREGGLSSTLWAGPEVLTREMVIGEIPVQGTLRKKPVALRLGFSGDAFSYTIELGLPTPSSSVFALDPVIKRECLWNGPAMRPKELCLDRRGSGLRCRHEQGKWKDLDVPLTPYASVLSEYADPIVTPELILVRDMIRSWRFYDHLRTDADAPARRAPVGTYTPVLADDGNDLASALQTIREIGFAGELAQTIEDAFPGSQLRIESHHARLEVALQQPGMLRSLQTSELSDGTLRYLLLAAALLTPRPPSLMILNEPETSLHPSLLPALGRMITRYASEQQIVVVTHAPALIETLTEFDQCQHHRLSKVLGATELQDADPIATLGWKWLPR